MAQHAQQAPWSVKGISPQTREAVKEAARHSGMTIGEWLNVAITHQARTPLAPRLENPSANDLRWAEIAAHLAKHVHPETMQSSQPHPASQIASIHVIERLLKESQSRQEQQSREQARHIAEALTGLARYIEHVEERRSKEAQKTDHQHNQVNAELAQTLNLVAQRIKRMEKQLTQMSLEMVEPLKQTTNKQMDILTDQVIPAMEERLAIQMRDILLNLSAKQETALTHSTDIEQLTIEDRLSRAIVDIRTRQVELARLEQTAYASDPQQAILERLEGLSRQLDAALISHPEKDTSPGLDAVLMRLDRIDARLDNPSAPLDIGHLENMVHDLSENIEALHLSHHNASATTNGKEMLDKLAEQISLLAQHLDHASRHSVNSLQHDGSATNNAAQNNTAHLAALETAISALSLQLRNLPAADTEALERVARSAAREALTALSAHEQNLPLRTNRTDDVLETVHTTLERVVDRLAKLENELNARSSNHSSSTRSAFDEPERRAAQALSQPLHYYQPLENVDIEGPEDLLARETTGLTEELGLTANFIAAARRAAIAATDETRFSSAIMDHMIQDGSEDTLGTISDAASARRRSLLIGVGALIAATGAAQISNFLMQGMTRLS